MGGRLKFGVFELDVHSRRLCKRGIHLQLPDQSLDILVMLVERPGEVVTREAIRERLWPHGTVVEFEHSVNSAVNRLRDCLGDSATSPRFIETLPWRGYRFLATVEDGGPSPWSPHFRILGEAGRGRMGVVYRAEDLRLGRTVALKFLPEELAHHSASVERLRQEARALASLNHPGICALYGIEEHEGRLCLVLEYLEGQPLSRLIEGGPLALKQALKIAEEASEALGAAHSRGIVHHDITPANIFVTREERVKILDFGLAKAMRRETAKEDPTPGAAIPEGGLAASDAMDGTTGYISPEQVRGEAADARSDVFSLGVVLYETLCGRSPFSGNSGGSMPTSALREEEVPSPRQYRPDIPKGVERILLRCLERAPEARYASAAELHRQLKKCRSPASSGTWRRVALWPLASLVVGAVIAAVGLWRWIRPSMPVPTAPQLVKRFVMGLPSDEPVALSGLSHPSIALSPDGTRLVYVAQRKATTQLCQRSMAQFEATLIPGTEGASQPFFSPDGRWVGFLTANQLKKVSIQGEVVTLCETRNVYGASWGADDTILIAEAEGGRLSRVPAAGGAPSPVIVRGPGVDAIFRRYRWPEVLPGARAALVSTTNGVTVLSLETGEERTLVEGGTAARYVPTGPDSRNGHLVFVKAGSLLAAPFDPVRVRFTGPATPVLHGIRTAASGAAQFTFSLDGSLIYVPGAAVGSGRLVWVDRRGAATTLAVPNQLTQLYSIPRISPDGRRLAITTLGATAPDTTIWIYELARGSISRLTLEGRCIGPVWTPDGKRVAFGCGRGRAGPPGIFWKSADGSGEEEQLLAATQYPYVPESWSPDGAVLTFVEYHAASKGDLWVLPLKGDRKPQLLVRTPFVEWGGRFSPDGRRIAYTSDESGRYEVYVRSYPGQGRWQISTDGGEEALWSPDGRELFYRNGQKWMVVAVAPTAEFRVDRPRLLFEGPYLNVSGYSYDIAPDGRRFLMLQPITQEETATQLDVVLGWFEELRRHVPSGG